MNVDTILLLVPQSRWATIVKEGGASRLWWTGLISMLTVGEIQLPI